VPRRREQREWWNREYPRCAGGIRGSHRGTQPAARARHQEHQCRYQFNFDGALSNGALRGNSVTGTSDTGTITTTGSINNNTGFTTVFQNSGNNSLFQQTTSINITVH
jgi:hypothetical protein